MGKVQSDWVRKVHEGMDYITAHLEQDVNLEQVAQACQMSKFHFHRVFRMVTGETVAQFSRRSRLQAAVRRLLTGKDSITEVAHKFGFSSAPNFNRAVKKEYGVAPGQMKERSLESFAYPAAPKRRHTPEQVILSQPKFEELPDQNVAYTRVYGVYKPIPVILKDCVQAYRQLMKWAERAKTSKRPVITATWDMPGLAPEEQCRADACIPIENKPVVMPEEGVTLGTLPGGFYLTTECQCWSFDFDSVYMAIMDWMDANDVQMGNGPGYELYECSFPKVLTGTFRYLVSVPVVER